MLPDGEIEICELPTSQRIEMLSAHFAWLIHLSSSRLR